METFGGRLKSAMGAKRLSVRGLAAKVSTAKETVQRHISGTTSPGMDILIKYAQVLEVTVDWLAYGTKSGNAADAATVPSEPVLKPGPKAEPTVPMVVAQLLATGRLGDVTRDEIAFLARMHRAEPGSTESFLEILLLSRRAAATGSVEDRQRLTEALNREAERRGERSIDLAADAPRQSQLRPEPKSPTTEHAPARRKR